MRSLSAKKGIPTRIYASVDDVYTHLHFGFKSCKPSGYTELVYP